MTRSILAIDQGTTNTKALLVSDEGRVLAAGSAPLAGDWFERYLAGTRQVVEP